MNPLEWSEVQIPSTKHLCLKGGISNSKKEIPLTQTLVGVLIFLVLNSDPVSFPYPQKKKHYALKEGIPIFEKVNITDSSFTMLF